MSAQSIWRDLTICKSAGLTVVPLALEQPLVVLVIAKRGRNDTIAKIGSESNIFVELADGRTGLTLYEEKSNKTMFEQSNQFGLDCFCQNLQIQSNHILDRTVK